MHAGRTNRDRRHVLEIIRHGEQKDVHEASFRAVYSL